MARMAIVLCLLIALFGASFSFFKDKLTAALQPIGTTQHLATVVAATTIQAGESFTSANTAIELQTIYNYDISLVGMKEVLYGRRAGKNIEKGARITIYDVMPEDRTKWTAYDEKLNNNYSTFQAGYQNCFISRKNIEKGEPILTMFVVNRLFPLNNSKTTIPVDAIRSLNEIMGTTANKSIKKDQIISRSDLSR
tara:strand:+ start:215 stop:799 length:585 start_codon:yes stop_codon:yes gene_type:complete